ncbi:MAG: hypothetical protein LBK82_05140 [Planctomycetaceae bacterium]|nr:hypothetical protein [Planctomycetaceae bacterium]
MAKIFLVQAIIEVGNHQVGDPFAEGSRWLSHNFAAVNLVHCRRVRRRDLSAKGHPPLFALMRFTD